MKFGKLPDIKNVDFSLPPDPEQNRHVLSRMSSAGAPLRFYIGCTGWSMKEWVGRVYPKGAKSRDFLKHYGSQFNTIELNTTHYHIPNFTAIDKWKTETPDDFQFCPKILQTISHSRDLGLSDSQMDKFCESIYRLDHKLGCSFIQLPPYFGIDRLPLLERFLDRFAGHIPLAVEVRQESWFSSRENTLKLAEALEKRRISTVITDVAGRRDVLHMRLSTDTAMIRFVGNGLHPSDYQRIEAWAVRIEEWRRMGLSKVYFFTHEPDNIHAPELAHYLLNLLKGKEEIIVRGPQFTDEAEGAQMSLF